MKQFLSFCICAVLAFAAPAAGLTTADGLSYDLQGGTATVAVGDYGALTEAIIPETVTDAAGHTYTVTAIAASAFNRCTALRHVAIPATVTSVGASAFYGCTLTSLYTGASLTTASAFSGCTVQTLYVGGGVMQFGALGLAPVAIYCLGDVPPVCADGTFSSYSAALHVTALGMAAYFTADVWNRFNNISADAVPAESLTLSLTEAELELGGTLQLEAELLPAGATGQPVRWSTTNAAVATVTTGGKVTACGTGTCEVAVTCLGLRRTCRVTVIPKVVTVSLDKHRATLRRNDIVYLTATTAPTTEEVQWSTTNAATALVRVVDGRAMVLAMRPGQADIVASTATRCHPDTCHITVERPAGDANGDGFTDVEDLNAIINVILDYADRPGEKDFPYFDLTGDGVIDVEDVNAVVNALLNPEPPKPQDPETRTFTVNGVSFTMVAVEGGTFTMGATPEQGDDAYSDEKPTHQVTLSSYSIGATEVTQELWVAVMGSNPSYFNGYGNSSAGSYHSSYNYGTNLQRPVECVSWNDCQTFITKLNSLTGENFRLPTEAEWEYAARGGSKSKGYKYSGSNTLGDVAWYCDNIPSQSSGTSGFGTQTVATKSPNELGLYDMSGNVWEWCQDWYDDYSSSSQTNPSGPSSGSNRVYRGGGWSGDARHCRVSRRDYGTPSSPDAYLGLRLAL